MYIEEIGRQAGTFRIINYLHQIKKQDNNGKVSVSKLGKDTKVNQAPLYRSLVLLNNYGIIDKEEHSDWFPPRKYYMLTDFGMEIAEQMIELDEKLKGAERGPNIL